MANITTHKVGKVTTIEEVKNYLEQRIEHVKKCTHGNLSNIERELRDLLEIVEIPEE